MIECISQLPDSIIEPQTLLNLVQKHWDTDKIDKSLLWDISRGLYWFCVENHSGQWSDLYRISCELGYTPGLLEKGADFSGNSGSIYFILSNKGNPTMTIKAAIKETQETPVHCAVCKATAEDADVDAPCEECSTLLCTLCDCPYCSEAPMAIEISGDNLGSDEYIVGSIEDVSTSEAVVTMTTGEEFRVFESLDDAESSVEEYWRDMIDHDREEFICIIGASRLLQWALGESDDYGIHSLEEFIQRNREACEETLATYDGREQYVIGFSSTLDNQTSLNLNDARAYRVN